MTRNKTFIINCDPDRCLRRNEGETAEEERDATKQKPALPSQHVNSSYFGFSPCYSDSLGVLVRRRNLLQVVVNRMKYLGYLSSID